jgi:nucleoside-diphosphate-sugar epimerase
LLLGSYARLNHFTGWTPEISFDQMLDDLFGYWRTVVAAS